MRVLGKGLIACALCAGILFTSPLATNAADKGWQETYGGYKYQLDDGSYQTGWFQYGGETYYFDKEGVMQTAAVRIGDEVYYFNTREDGNTGAMQTGVVRIHGKLFLFDCNGVCVESTYGKEKPVAYTTFDKEGNFVSRLILVRDF